MYYEAIYYSSTIHVHVHVHVLYVCMDIESIVHSHLYV